LALHIALFLLTLLTTTIVGAGLAQSFRDGAPVDLDRSLLVFVDFPRHPALLLDGLPFSLTLLLILLAHEMGHYLTCLRYGIDASLPYFLPAPTLIGTFGAFIRIRSPIYTKRALFDVGIAGPLAGFALLLPALAIGVANSKVIHGIAMRGDYVFGTPAILRIFEWAIFPGVPSADIYLHPMARAAWVGILATALNLLPIGQLDGGHILYSFVGPVHRRLSKIFLGALVGVAVFSSVYYDNWLTGAPWLLWAVLLIFALRHPAICDISPMDPLRTKLGWLALVIFLLCFTLAPIRTLA
jgi:membrane-associated protease RseP (regulator of RpoE activity)